MENEELKSLVLYMMQDTAKISVECAMKSMFMALSLAVQKANNFDEFKQGIIATAKEVEEEVKKFNV